MPSLVRPAVALIAALALAGCTPGTSSPDPSPTTPPVASPTSGPGTPASSGIPTARVGELFRDPVGGVRADGPVTGASELQLNLPGCDLSGHLRAAGSAQKLQGTTESGPRGVVTAYTTESGAGTAFTQIAAQARECAPAGTTFTDAIGQNGSWVKAQLGPAAVVMV